MQQRVDEAYVVRTQDLGESDVIVTLLAENAGIVKGVARAARRSRRRFGGALEPLTRVTVTWTAKEGRDLQRIESLEPRRSYAELQSDPSRQAACAVLAEIGAAVAREEQADPTGFRLMGSVLDALEEGLDPLIAVRYFEYWTLRLHGLLPDLQTCHLCGRELPGKVPRLAQRGVGVVCRSCVGGTAAPSASLEPPDLGFLKAASTSAPAKMPDDRRAVGPGGALEVLLRGTLESYVERSFRTYRHLYHSLAAMAPGSPPR